MAKIHDLAAQTSRDLQSEYRSFLVGVDGVWMQFTQTLGAGPAYSRMNLAAGAEALLRAHGPLIERLARTATQEAYKQGTADAGGAYPMPTEHLFDEAVYWGQSALARDLRVVLQRGQQTLLRYAVATRSMGPACAKQAALGELPSQAGDVFVQLDRAGRRRTSVDWMDAGVRLAMFKAYGVGFVESLANAGQRQFEVYDASDDGDAIEVQTLDLIESEPTWMDFYLHPNTRWALRRKESA
jgi:hypothetical protein